MGYTDTIKCKNCGHKETFYINADSWNKDQNYFIKNTFICDDCGKLLEISIPPGKMECTYCGSKKISKHPTLSTLKCQKCGSKGFEVVKSEQD